MFQIITILLLNFMYPALEVDSKLKLTESEKWKLGWRMTMSAMDNNNDLGELQFDSLLATKSKIDKKFILAGLEILKKKNKPEKISLVLKDLDKDALEFICSKNLLNETSQKLKYCKPANTKAENPDLQLQIIKMFVKDQLVRDGKMDNIIAKYNLVKNEFVNIQGATNIDAENKDKLQEIFTKYGFPTKKMVGEDAMRGIFILIQHADNDIDWQKSQLPQIKKAVKDGDMDGQSYAYLYDRIRVNSGQKQLYGTQFVKVDPINKVIELAATEDLGNLDKRRMEIGMMPIETYKTFMLNSLKK